MENVRFHSTHVCLCVPPLPLTPVRKEGRKEGGTRRKKMDEMWDLNDSPLQKRSGEEEIGNMFAAIDKGGIFTAKEKGDKRNGSPVSMEMYNENSGSSAVVIEVSAGNENEEENTIPASTTRSNKLFGFPIADVDGTEPHAGSVVVTHQFFPVDGFAEEISPSKENVPVHGAGCAEHLPRAHWVGVKFCPEGGTVQVSQPIKKSRRGPRSRSSQYRGVTFYRRTGRWESHIW